MYVFAASIGMFQILSLILEIAFSLVFLALLIFSETEFSSKAGLLKSLNLSSLGSKAILL